MSSHVLRFEKDQRDIEPELIQAIRRAYEAAGVRFLEEGERCGVLKPRLPPIPCSRNGGSLTPPLRSLNMTDNWSNGLFTDHCIGT